MTANKFIQKLLRLKGVARVQGWEFKNWGKDLFIRVKPDKNGRCCPHCQRRGRFVRRFANPRSWRDPPIGKTNIHFIYNMVEILCPTHGRVQEEIPWGEAFARVTYRFEFGVFYYCREMTQKAAAHVLHISTSTLSDLLHRGVNRVRSKHKIRGLKILGLDEISYLKGKRYATIAYDLDRGRVLWVGKGKGRKTADKFFSEALSDYQKSKIEAASCDMSQAYIGAIKAHCPNAVLVLDRFHIVKALNGAVDEVRKEEWQNIPESERKAMIGVRWILFKHSSKRTENETTVLKALNKSNRRIYRASVLKDEFDQFWDFCSEDEAEKFLKGWMTTALKSRLEPIRDFVKTIRKQMKNLLPFVKTRLTNAKAEGINRIIKIIKNRASGFRNLSSFEDLIFLCIGDVNIPAQIPTKFRSI